MYIKMLYFNTNVLKHTLKYMFCISKKELTKLRFPFIFYFIIVKVVYDSENELSGFAFYIVYTLHNDLFEHHKYLNVETPVSVLSVINHLDKASRKRR